MNAQDLKNSILQLAIQGKLVEQREEEGTAKELLEKIEAEKKQLIKEGKIKKQKALPDIKDDEIPFDIPESWEWVRVGDIGSWSAGATPSRSNPKYYGGDIPWLKTGDLNDGYIMEVPEFISEEALEKTSVRLNPIGSVLMAMYGATIGKLGILNIEATTNQACCACIPYSIIYNKYLFYYLMGQRRVYIKMGAGGAQPNISKEKIINSIVPLPPLEEQKRIVAKIEELMPYVDKYDVAYSEVEELNKKFPEDMQKSILQYAIQGKLVEQRKEDGTAKDLYKQIQEEKKKLIKEGKIKKQKALPEITEDEIPFVIPENWKWVRLGDIVSFYGGYAYKSSTYVNKSNNMIIRIGNVKNDKLLLDVNPVFIPQEIADVTIKYKILPNDILFTMTGTRKKRDYFYTTLINEEDLNRFELFLNQRVGCLRNDCKIINMRWLSLALKSEAILSQIFSFETGTANQGNIGSDNTMGLMIPLPPFDEQERIVAKVGEFLPYTKQLIKKVD